MRVGSTAVQSKVCGIPDILRSQHFASNGMFTVCGKIKFCELSLLLYRCHLSRPRVRRSEKYSHGVPPDQQSCNAWRCLGNTRKPFLLESATRDLGNTWTAMRQNASARRNFVYRSCVEVFLNERVLFETGVDCTRVTHFGRAHGG